MSEAKHTPGPWTFTGTRLTSRSPYARCEAIVSVGAPHNTGNTIAIVHMGGDGAISAAEADIAANARLIAAAPELFEAAKLVLAWYEAEDDHSKADFYRRIEMCRASEAAIRAAIAKAQGE